VKDPINIQKGSPPRKTDDGYLGPANTHASARSEGDIVGVGGKGKIDGLEKITGAAIFTDDIQLPRMAHAKVLRSPHPHAKILSIDTTPALAMSGVLAVMTGDDLPTTHGAIPIARDETALAVGRVRYVGEPVVCVAATSEAIARAACNTIRVVYEPIDAIFTIEDALDPELPPIHPTARKASNVLRRVHQHHGDVDAGMAEADLVMEGIYEYPGSTHVPLEAHAAVANPLPEGRLQIWSSTQNPHYVHKTLAHVLGMEESDIRLIKPSVGAGYGGKCDTFVTDLCSAWLARKLDRPVKMSLEREEVFYAHRGRHRTRMWIKMGMKSDGTITAVDFKAWADGGAYASYGVVTAYYLGVFLTLPYTVENARFTTLRLYTNHPPCGPKRGHGALQPRFAFETHLDKMATELGLEPARVRRKQIVAPGTKTANGLQVTSVGLKQCMEEVLLESGYAAKRGRLPPGRGVGLATSVYMCGALHGIYPDDLPHSGVQIQIDRSGRVTIFAGTADVGQGSSHMLATVVAERLGIAVNLCRVVEGDTDLCPVDLGSYSSRVTFMAGNAALQAADRLRSRIATVVADHLHTEVESLIFRHGQITNGHVSIDWKKAIRLAEAATGTLGSSGSYRPPNTGTGFKRNAIGPSPAYSFTAQVAEVQVDMESGMVVVDKIWCAHDLGRVLHPEIAEGQIEGCVYMGVGEALFEEQTYRDGQMRTPSMLEYRVPTIYDTPEIHSILIESHDPGGPFGAKEVGEGPQLATVPAITNAIFDATGHWLHNPPFTPDKVLRALQGHGPLHQKPLPPDRPTKRSD
jgi:4-hydroxybenzoyl-CoA reductase subunit alpha